MKQQVFTTHGAAINKIHAESSSPPAVTTKSRQEGPRGVAVSHDIQTFLGEVSIGGVKYVVIPKASNVRRLIWLAMVLAGMTFAVYQIADRIIHFASWPTSVNIRVHHVPEIRFPTVTVCNENRVMLSKLQAIGGSDSVALMRAMNPPLGTDAGGSIDFESLGIDISAYDAVDWDFMYRAVAQNLSHALVYCVYDGQRCSAADFVQVATNAGICYQFNSAHANYTTRHAGGSYGLKMILAVEQREYIAPIKGSVSAGFRIGLHAAKSAPLMKEWGFRVDSGQQTLISVTAHEVVDPGLPYVNCSKAENYSYTDCVIKCEEAHVVDKCNCRDIYMPGNASLCNPLSTFECMEPVQDAYIVENLASQCDCLRQCNTTTYSYAISSATASNNFMDLITSTLNFLPDSMTVEERRAYMQDEFVMVEIFMGEVGFEQMLTSPAYTPLALLCDIGGAMGLVLGSTLLTVFEVVDFVIVMIYHALLIRKNPGPSKK